MDRTQLLAHTHDRLEQERGIVAAWVFGSTARGTSRADSDVDVAILFDVEPADTFDLEAALARALGCETQVVSVRHAPVDLLHRILRDGVLLLDRDRAKRIAFEVDARNRYFDMRPILLEYRRPRTGAA